MKKIKNSRAGVLCSPIALGLALVLVGPVQAQPVQSETSSTASSVEYTRPGQGVSLHYGYHGRYQRLGLAYETPSLWNYAFSNNSSLDLSVEFGAGYWMADKGHPDSLWHLAMVPVLRWWPGKAYYLELGVGPSLISRTRFAGKQLSTRFQFTSHIGGGIVVDKVHRFGLRYTHVSNASIKRPNPGLDLIEASYTYQF